MDDKRTIDLLKLIVLKYEDEQLHLQAPSDHISLTLLALKLFPSLANEKISLVDVTMREITSKDLYLAAVEQGLVMVHKREQPAEAFAEWYNGCFWKWSKMDRKLHKIDALAPSELTWSHCCVFLTEITLLFFSSENTLLFEIRSNTLTTKSRMSVGRYYFAYVLLNGLLYVLGGCDEAGSTDICERFNPTLNKWTYVCSHPGPGRTGMSACGFLSKFIYLFGGFDGVSYLDHICKYSLEDGMWRSLAVRLPLGTYYLASVQFQGKILVFGGKNVRKSYWLHTDTLLITEGPPLPSDLPLTKFRHTPIITAGKVQIMNLDYRVLELSNNQWSVIYSIEGS